MSAVFAVAITDAAERDLTEIIDEIHRRASAMTADALLDDLLASIATLERFPERGAIPDELAKLGMREFRQLVFQAYRLIYRVIGDEVYVLLIADGRRDMQALLERRLLQP